MTQRLAMRRGEVTADSCCTLRQAGGVTPGSCHSPRRKRRKHLASLISPGPPPKHALSGVIHPARLGAESVSARPVTASHPETEEEEGRGEGSIRLFTYGKVTNSLQALC